jgi:hypothetical protein
MELKIRTWKNLELRGGEMLRFAKILDLIKHNI